jgi:hypothetical protein
MGTRAKSLTEQWGDGFIRALRTFYASVGMDILVAIGAGLLLLLEGDPMSPTFWLAFGALVVRSALTGVATYWMRLKFPPKTV